MYIVIIWLAIFCYLGFQALVAIVGFELIMSALAPIGRLIKKVIAPLFQEDNLKVLAQIGGLIAVFLIHGLIEYFHH